MVSVLIFIPTGLILILNKRHSGPFSTHLQGIRYRRPFRDDFGSLSSGLLNLFCHDVLLLINWYRPCSSSWILTIRLRQRSLSGKQSMAWRPPLLLWRSRRLPVGQGRPRRRHLAQMPRKAQPHPLEPLVGGAAHFSIKTRGETRSVLMMSLRLVARHQLDELLLVHLLVCQIRPIMEQRVRRDGRWSVLCRLPALDMD